MIKTHTKNGITKQDEKTILNLVEQCPLCNTSTLILYLNRSIKNITPNHIFFMGLVIGQIQATEKTLENIYNQLQPCQRQN